MKHACLHDLLLSDDLKAKCPGLAEPVYEFAKYIGEHIPEGELSPETFSCTAVLALDDILKGRCGFLVGDSDFPQYLVEHREEVLIQAPFVLQIIDAITDEEFATETRNVCKSTLEWDPPKKPVADNIHTVIPDDGPANIAAAVNWWKNALTSPKMDNGDPTMGLFMTLLGSSIARSNTEEAIAKFCEELSKQLCEESKNGQDAFYLIVDYGPGRYLRDACERADVNLQFPCKTYMAITRQKVSVSCGYQAPEEEIWSDTP